ncbi:TetR/AcrR family transcriptional regulator [Bosea sp. (in: a-proteobacteria)]|uniref:TetR/AcrR family transcriptional regulator n=1 Tax=Bosea sp. (in: a-proteobacteria) TaxID=1871050 RepID=UPI002FC5E2BA
MSPASVRKLPKPERREQLLDCALAIVREDGTEALTLGRLAERAGVSKPVAYDHFGTREALIIALYRRIDDRQTDLLAEGLRHVEPRLEPVASEIARAYMDCAISVGPEWHALSAALKGSEAMEAVQRELIARYLGFYQAALAPFARALPPEELELRCIAILGAAEAVSLELLRANADRQRAVATLAGLIVAAIRAPAS